MNDYSFTANGSSHSLRIRPLDLKDDETVVYEGLVDRCMYVFWEGPAELDEWDLIGAAILAYKEEVGDDSTEIVGWSN